MSTAAETKPATPPTPEPVTDRVTGKPVDIKPIPARDWQTEGGLYASRHFVTIKAADYPAILTDNRYLTLVENKLTAMDRVEFRTHENLFIAEAVIAEVVQRSYVRMVEIWRVEINKVATELPKATGEFYVTFLGGNRHWAVVHPNGSICRDGILSKVNAEHELHVRKQGSPINTMAGR
jgi:hypothetical protein